MRIDIATVSSVAELRALIAGAEDTVSIDWVKTPKKNLTGSCWCGCGESTKSRFAPGHDSKFHSLAKQVARGQAEMPTEWVNDEAEADFMKWHDREVPVWAAKQAEKAASKAAKVKATKTEPVVEPESDEADEAALEALLAEVSG